MSFPLYINKKSVSEHEELLDACIKVAIKIGRKHMRLVSKTDPAPTSQEWQLALILFEKSL